MIYCVWYPSGGFGHFVNSILSLYGKNFVRPKKHLEFSKDGNSHNLDLVVPKYKFQSWPYQVDFDTTKNYSVLIDNGINDEGDQFRNCFPGSQVVKICYTDQSWPIVARTMIDKAMNSSLQQQLPLSNNWDSKEKWAVREKYFLFLRDHEFRNCWKPNHSDTNLHVDSMLNYFDFFEMLESCGVELEPFESVWHQWRLANSVYIEPVQHVQQIMHNMQHGLDQDLSSMTDLWAQAVLYYYVWINYGVEVPHNDFADFLGNTAQIRDLIQ